MSKRDGEGSKKETHCIQNEHGIFVLRYTKYHRGLG